MDLEDAFTTPHRGAGRGVVRAVRFRLPRRQGPRLGDFDGVAGDLGDAANADAAAADENN